MLRNLGKQKEPQNYKSPVLIYFFPEEKIDSAYRDTY